MNSVFDHVLLASKKVVVLFYNILLVCIPCIDDKNILPCIDDKNILKRGRRSVHADENSLS